MQTEILSKDTFLLKVPKFISMRTSILETFKKCNKLHPMWQKFSDEKFKISPGFDKLRNGSSQTFFHFKVYGLKMCKANFIITRMNIIQRLIKGNEKEDNKSPYFPVFRKPNQDFQKVELEVKKYVHYLKIIQYNCFDEPQLSFSFEFDQDQFVQFAFSYPYNYDDCEKLIKELEGKFQGHQSIYFHNEILCYSQKKKNVHLVTITDKQNCENNKEQQIQDLFPQNKDRCLKTNKPVILMSARVHPGQSPSSFAIQGALRFLLNEQDFRSHLLRKNFVIKIIPMLNPDGVFHGRFRTDLNEENLNRIYIECDKNLHSTIWSFRKYSEFLSKTQNVLFFFDFHAHPSTKNFFIYGNSYSEITLQTEVQFFGKLIETNCPYFQNFQSIFSVKQMRYKHKNDNYSKEGCARVFMHKLFDIVHSYTVECGYFGWTKLNYNEDKEHNEKLHIKGFLEDKQFEEIPERTYNPQSYMLMGKSILITILDLFNLNPYPKKIKGQHLPHLELRKSVGLRIYQENETYKMIDANSYKKLSELSSLIEDTYYASKLKGTKLKLSTDETNNLLMEQIAQVNGSPRKIKQRTRMTKNMKIKSLSTPKISRFADQRQIHKLRSHSKLQTLPKDILISNDSNDYRRLNSKNNLPPLIGSKSKASTLIKSQDYMNISRKAQDIKFLYNDSQRFNEEEELFVAYYSSPEKKVREEKENLSNKSSFENSKTKDLSHMRQHSNASAEDKSFLPSTRDSKIRSNLEQTLIQKSLTLRKGSVSKIVYLKKDDIKFLRISNLIEKKNQRQAIHYPTKNNFKNNLDSNATRNLPFVNGIKKI